MTPAEFASRLTGREIGNEITIDEAAEAKALGLLVVFGASDDLVELRGAIDDEVGACDGTTIRITSGSKKIVPSFDSIDHDDERELEAYFLLKHETFREIEALWCAETDTSWTFKTDTPHATFEVMEDGGVFCRGIVLHP